MTDIDPHAAERLILIGCHEAAARKHALRLMLQPSEREVWKDIATKFLNDTVKYDSTTCAVFVQAEYREWPETQAIVKQVHEHYKQARINQNTVEAIGEAQGRNFVRNLRRIVHEDGRLRDALTSLPSMKGRTAIVCGAGPSFDQSGAIVSRHRGPIIAVNTSAGACAQHGIKPHAVVCTESRMVREGIVRMDPRASYFAMDLIGHTGNWFTEDETYTEAQLCFLGTEPNLAPYAQMLDMLPLAYGSSCTTAAVSLALACGARRVALVGQDCAFQLMQGETCPTTDGSGGELHTARMYASGTPYEETVVLIHTGQMRARIEKPTVPSHTVDVVRASGIVDEQVFTTHSMLSFSHWFRDQPEDVRERVVNCTGRGVHIEGLAHDSIDNQVEDLAYEGGPERYSVGRAGPSAAGQFAGRAAKVLRHLSNVASHGLTLQKETVLLEWARRHAILNMWIAPERLRMRRMDGLSQAERGHRVAAVVRTACSEIVACADGEL